MFGIAEEADDAVIAMGFTHVRFSTGYGRPRARL